MNLTFGSIVPIEKSIYKDFAKTYEHNGAEAGNYVSIGINTLNPPHQNRAKPEKVSMIRSVAPDFDPAVGVMIIEQGDKSYMVTGKEYTKAKNLLQEKYLALWETTWQTVLSPTTFNVANKIRSEAEKVLQVLLASPDSDIKAPVTYVHGGETTPDGWKDIEMFVPFQA